MTLQQKKLAILDYLRKQETVTSIEERDDFETGDFVYRFGLGTIHHWIRLGDNYVDDHDISDIQRALQAVLLRLSRLERSTTAWIDNNGIRFVEQPK